MYAGWLIKLKSVSFLCWFQWAHWAFLCEQFNVSCLWKLFLLYKRSMKLKLLLYCTIAVSCKAWRDLQSKFRSGITIYLLPVRQPSNKRSLRVFGQHNTFFIADDTVAVVHTCCSFFCKQRKIFKYSLFVSCALSWNSRYIAAISMEELSAYQYSRRAFFIKSHLTQYENWKSSLVWLYIYSSHIREYQYFQICQYFM